MTKLTVVNGHVQDADHHPSETETTTETIECPCCGEKIVVTREAE